MADDTRKKWLHFLHSRWAGILGFGIGVVLLVWGGVSSTESEETTEYTVQYYTQSLEKRITELCTSVSGITEATVLLTLDSGSEFVYAQNSDIDGDTSQAWDYVIVSGGDGEEAVMVTEIFPKVRGVAVVCTGGDSAVVQQTIINLLSAALGISSNRIRVAGR